MRHHVGKLTITTKAQILASIWLLVSFSCAFSSYDYSTNKIKLFRMIFWAVNAFSSLLVFVACRERRAVLMLPIMACSTVPVLATGTIFTICLYALFDLNWHIPQVIRYYQIYDEDAFPTDLFNSTAADSELSDWRRNVFALTVFLTILSGISFAISLWMFSVFALCYQELRMKKTVIVPSLLDRKPFEAANELKLL
ncbi:hypothetical protein PMAYCL1PPCAC_03131, partial [Pristionchus mayeri]